jgi:hypothetical protein
VDDKGFMTCEDCGKELYRTMSHEWRLGDENRVSYRRKFERSVRNDVKGLNFADIVVNKADCLYQQFKGRKV